MPTVNANRVGSAIGVGSGTFSTARESNAETVVDNPTNTDTNTIQHFFDTGRGGGTHKIRRVFIHFDTSGISVAPQDATLNIQGATNTSADVIVVKSTAMSGDGSTALAASEFFSSIDYSTAYSSEVSSWSTSANNITLNSTALTDIGNNNNFTVAVIEHDSDFQNTANTSGTVAAGIAYGTTITLTYTAGLTSPGYTHKVSGVASANIKRVNTVDTANIGKINTVD
tara:strand:+ start:165 stop:845 length:681 start_codon:yes stop_codon:yes gene_type:complete